MFPKNCYSAQPCKNSFTARLLHIILRKGTGCLKLVDGINMNFKFKSFILFLRIYVSIKLCNTNETYYISLDILYFVIQTFFTIDRGRAAIAPPPSLLEMAPINPDLIPKKDGAGTGGFQTGFVLV